MMDESRQNSADVNNPHAELEPRIIRKAFSLIGAQSKIEFGADFGPVLDRLYDAVTTKLTRIPGLVEPARMIGFWHMGDMPSGGREYRYFAGVEAHCAKVPEGLVSITLPESLYAAFTEQRRGTIGGPGGYAYKQWLPGSEYESNEAIPGDFEVFKNLTHTDPHCEAEILIPIKARHSA